MVVYRISEQFRETVYKHKNAERERNAPRGRESMKGEDDFMLDLKKKRTVEFDASYEQMLQLQMYAAKKGMSIHQFLGAIVNAPEQCEKGVDNILSRLVHDGKNPMDAYVILTTMLNAAEAHERTFPFFLDKMREVWKHSIGSWKYYMTSQDMREEYTVLQQWALEHVDILKNHSLAMDLRRHSKRYI